LPNLFFKFRRDPFIGVHQQDPFFGRLGMGKSLLVAIACPFSLDHAIRVPPADFRRAIRAESVHDDNLVAPAQALQTGADVPFFVETDHDSGNRRYRKQISGLTHNWPKIGVDFLKIKLAVPASNWRRLMPR
jgi:hypothetical protein